MRHRWLFWLSACGAWLAQPALAAAADPLIREDGFYLAWWKLLLWWLLFAAFARAADWVNRDCQDVGERHGLDSFVWNAVVVFVSLGVFLVGCLAIPIFFVGYPLAVLGLVVPLTIYIVRRNKSVMEDQRVMTPKHIANWFANLGKRDKKPIAVKLPHELGPPVDFIAKGGKDKQEDQANLIIARQSPGYVPAKELIADALDSRADRIMLDYTREAVTAKYEIDGVWQNAPSRERDVADHFLGVFKKLAARDPAERRARQQGLFTLTYKDPKEKMDAELVSQGTQTGERVIIKIDHGTKGFETLEKIGLRDTMREQLIEYLRGEKGGGIILVSAMPGGGMTTTFSAVLRATDRLLRDFVCLEDVNQRSPYVENIEVQKYNAAAGETPDKLLPKVMLKQPDVYVLPELPNAETVRILCREALDENRLVIAAVRAKEAVEALLRVLLTKAPAQEFAEAVKVVLNVRLIRKLADTCKQAYPAPPQVLQKLGLPAGRVRELYKEWQPNPEAPKRKPPPGACEFCGLVGPSCRGLGYLGRTGIFELLEVNDALREALVKQPKLEVLRQVARQSGHRGLQEEGILLVAQGVTSLTELQRVLKQ